MSDQPVEAVYDCVIYVQAIINPNGPAGECISKLLQGDVIVYASAIILAEIREVASRPSIAIRFGISAVAVDEYLANLLTHLRIIKDVPSNYQLEVDPDDEHYLNLAIATGSNFVVTRDHHLLDLMNDTAVAKDFRARFPDVRILGPTSFLQLLRNNIPPI